MNCFPVSSFWHIKLICNHEPRAYQIEIHVSLSFLFCFDAWDTDEIWICCGFFCWTPVPSVWANHGTLESKNLISLVYFILYLICPDEYVANDRNVANFLGWVFAVSVAVHSTSKFCSLAINLTTDVPTLLRVLPFKINHKMLITAVCLWKMGTKLLLFFYRKLTLKPERDSTVPGHGQTSTPRKTDTVYSNANRGHLDSFLDTGATI